MVSLGGEALRGTTYYYLLTEPNPKTKHTSSMISPRTTAYTSTSNPKLQMPTGSLRRTQRTMLEEGTTGKTPTCMVIHWAERRDLEVPLISFHTCYGWPQMKSLIPRTARARYARPTNCNQSQRQSNQPRTSSPSSRRKSWCDQSFTAILL
jgi:hypothetical protein